MCSFHASSPHLAFVGSCCVRILFRIALVWQWGRFVLFLQRSGFLATDGSGGCVARIGSFRPCSVSVILSSLGSSTIGRFRWLLRMGFWVWALLSGWFSIDLFGMFRSPLLSRYVRRVISIAFQICFEGRRFWAALRNLRHYRFINGPNIIQFLVELKYFCALCVCNSSVCVSICMVV